MPAEDSRAPRAGRGMRVGASRAGRAGRAVGRGAVAGLGPLVVAARRGPGEPGPTRSPRGPVRAGSPGWWSSTSSWPGTPR